MYSNTITTKAKSQSMKSFNINTRFNDNTNNYQQSRMLILIIKSITNRKISRIFQILKNIPYNDHHQQLLHTMDTLYKRKLQDYFYRIQQYGIITQKHETQRRLMRINKIQIVYSAISKIYRNNKVSSFNKIKNYSLNITIKLETFENLINYCILKKQAKDYRIGFMRIIESINHRNQTEMLLKGLCMILGKKICIKYKQGFKGIVETSQGNQFEQVTNKLRYLKRMQRKKRTIDNQKRRQTWMNFSNLKYQVYRFGDQNSKKIGQIKVNKARNHGRAVNHVKKRRNTQAELLVIKTQLTKQFMSIQQIYMSRLNFQSKSMQQNGAISTVMGLYEKLTHQKQILQKSKNNGKFELNKQKFKSMDFLAQIQQLPQYYIIEGLNHQNLIMQYQQISPQQYNSNKVSQHYQNTLNQNIQLKNIIKQLFNYQLVLKFKSNNLNQQTRELNDLFNEQFTNMQQQQVVQDYQVNIPTLNKNSDCTSQSYYYKKQTMNTSVMSNDIYQ